MHGDNIMAALEKTHLVVARLIGNCDVVDATARSPRLLTERWQHGNEAAPPMTGALSEKLIAIRLSARLLSVAFSYARESGQLQAFPQRIPRLEIYTSMTMVTN
jgi:hypothetical protein